MISQLLDGLVFRAQQKAMKKYLSESGLLDKKALDLGCGYGWYSQLFTGDYIGIDIDADRVAIAGQKFPGKRFLEMSADKLSFPDTSFDLVISFLVLHHLTDEQLARALSEVKRVLKPGGKFVVIDLVWPKRFSFLAWPLFVLDRAERRLFSVLTRFIERSGLKVDLQYHKNYGIFASAFFEIE